MTAIIGGIILIIALAFIFTRNSDETTPTTTDGNNTTENGENKGGESGNNGQQPAPAPQATPEPENPGNDAIRLVASSFQPSDGELTTSTTASITVWNFRTESLQITCTYLALFTQDATVIEENTYVAQPGNNEFSEILSGVDVNANNLTVKCEPSASVLPANWDSLTPREKTDLNPLGCDIEIQIIWADDGSCHLKPPEDAITETPEEHLSSRTALDDYLKNSEYTQLEKVYAMQFYCDLNTDNCITWKFINYYDEDDFDRYGRCQTLPREGSFCGDIAAYKRWQEVTETAEYASLYDKAEKAWEEYIRFGDGEIRGNDKEGYILQNLLHSVSPELRLEYGMATTIFAQADIIMTFLK